MEISQSFHLDIKRLSLSDFYINPDAISNHHLENRTFPATCKVDNNRVLLKLHEVGKHPIFKIIKFYLNLFI